VLHDLAATVRTSRLAGSLVANAGTSLAVAIVVTLLACLVVGAVNGLVVVGLGIESLIATLATGSLIAAVSSLLTDDTPIYDPNWTVTQLSLEDIVLAYMGRRANAAQPRTLEAVR